MASALFELPSRTLVSGEKNLNLSRPILMGILNPTPDSFSEDSNFFEFDDALSQAMKIIADGADWLDIGGESSGPGSTEVPLEEELRRVIPLIKEVRSESDIWISVDTWKAEVARQSLDAGADAVNDVSALRADKEMAGVIAEYQVPVILMYSKDSSPRTTRNHTEYRDVMHTIISFFRERFEYTELNGIFSDKCLHFAFLSPLSKLVLIPKEFTSVITLLVFSFISSSISIVAINILFFKTNKS